MAVSAGSVFGSMIIHNFSVNSHLIKVSASCAASMGVPGFRYENTPFGWQKAPRTKTLLAVLK